jgi:hypothetical protein
MNQAYRSVVRDEFAKSTQANFQRAVARSGHYLGVDRTRDGGGLALEQARPSTK